MTRKKFTRTKISWFFLNPFESLWIFQIFENFVWLIDYFLNSVPLSIWSSNFLNFTSNGSWKEYLNTVLLLSTVSFHFGRTSFLNPVHRYRLSLICPGIHGLKPIRSTLDQKNVKSRAGSDQYRPNSRNLGQIRTRTRKFRTKFWTGRHPDLVVSRSLDMTW